MATSEEKIEDLTEKYSDLHTVVNVLAAKVDATNEKVDNLISEMRDRDNQRAAEISEMRQAFQNMQNSLMEMQTSNRHQNVLVIIGVAAMVIAVILK